MTYYIGVDIAKYTHYACILNHNGEVLASPFAFDNNIDGFQLFLSKFSSLNANDVHIGFESTAHYHQNLFNFLLNKGYQPSLLNPILTKRFRGLNIRNCKNDKVDASTIASFMLYQHPASSDSFTNELAMLCKEREFIKNQLSTDKIRLTAYLDRTFPELKNKLSNSIYSKGYLNLLKEFNSAELIKKTRSDKLLNTVNKYKTFVSKDQISQIKSLAKNSVGFHSDALSLSISNCVYQIELFSEQLKQIDKHIEFIIDSLDSSIMKIPGMGKIQAAYILAVINKISSFDNASKIVAMAGLDPIVRQSGTFNASKTRMSKRGNALLRYALIWSALNVCKHSDTLNTYYLKKRSEGKNHYNALGHCAKKLCNYIFFVLKNPDKEFILE